MGSCLSDIATMVEIPEGAGDLELNTAASLRYQAGLLIDKGDLGGAQPLLERALAIRERVFGAGHSNTVQNLRDLADLLQKKDDFAGARSGDLRGGVWS